MVIPITSEDDKEPALIITCYFPIRPQPRRMEPNSIQDNAEGVLKAGK